MYVVSQFLGSKPASMLPLMRMVGGNGHLRGLLRFPDQVEAQPLTRLRKFALPVNWTRPAPRKR